ncbi:MAG TPA: hypothetical protein VHA11_14345 [Bryobacteraceae bacterium]|nr:hypothetical protein [Bryobacteraceae bacterium]
MPVVTRIGDRRPGGTLAPPRGRVFIVPFRNEGLVRSFVPKKTDTALAGPIRLDSRA